MKDYNLRTGTIKDLDQVRDLAINSWSRFQYELMEENRAQLLSGINNEKTYLGLFDTADCIVCETKDQDIVGMVFLVSSGHPTDIYPGDWCYIRFLTVSPEHEGKGIGRWLTQKCLDKAKSRGEHTIALHTSELMNNARALYENMGFEIVKEIAPRFGKRYWLYKRVL
ncbi:GNAT family N-acetyltransferase [Niabella soli]|uniref:Acetyltransferase n=1 Tax=Niabella soli DSM 19437 TaxID=929713 RepID=W0F482_9BACT|nr:GNAT family N-acetyltransferase [Niabella soli]AHF16623.1 acetyltransferase [Niabella soli DSM 19437]